LGAVALTAMAGCSTTVSSYQASAENAALLPHSAASVAVGQFVLSSEGGGRRMMLRGVHRLESPIGEDFAAYLGESLRRELALAGKWDPKAPTEITGVLLKTAIGPTGLLTQTGEIEARFTGLDGSVSVLELVQAPRLFGLAAFAAAQSSSYEALARRPSQLLVIGPAAYLALMDGLPGFARALLAEFAHRYDGTLRLLEASRHRSAPERFQLALAQLRRERALGPPQQDGWQAVRATQAELAALANLSRQTVNQLLAQAEEEGLLRRSYRCLWLRG